jgi:DNA-binding transcriptional regulator GbsR (MarR family)
MQRTKLVDEIGAFFEAHGMSRIAGQLFAYLLMSDPPEQSFDDLCAATGASRGSVSTMTRVLVQLGMLERLPRGGRKLAYRVHPDAWTRLLEDDLRSATRLRELAGRGLRVTSRQRPEARKRLQEMQQFYEFLERQTERSLAAWKRR